MAAWISEQFNFLWDQCVNYYHVDPVIFSVMYIIKNIIFWWLMAVIVRRALRRQWDGLVLLVVFNAFIDVLPWVYVWIWGDNHPWWYQYMVYAIGGWCFIGIYLDIKRKAKNREMESMQKAAEGDAGKAGAASKGAAVVAATPDETAATEAAPEGIAVVADVPGGTAATEAAPEETAGK